MITPIGFFRELNTSGSKGDHYAASIYDALADVPRDDESKIVQYLQSGRVVFDIMEMCRDVIGGGVALPGGSSVLTDGQWAWRQDLAFYVTKYHVSLPTDFVAHIIDNAYQVPAIDRELVLRVASEVAPLI